ncbi:hypothetical protein BU14_0161s0060 [Porphyra umbilicalis]|uniref:Uncharacterized protein n=1 Tax=Porphyra umbilicalis TaxID=2786 RepID=A0A1X6P8C3_PORUM|nr:hypothetical protein BU14_0161s0060 [Porphyra umbilicalis]|eukprot:OSX77141.1 hypothetical protein BU14_0161s0060 [Porphyra umbilicalis]
MQRLRRLKHAVESVTVSDVLGHVAPDSASPNATPAADGDASASASGDVRVTNLVHGEALPYPLCLLEGTASGGATAVTVAVSDGAPASFAVMGGAWKAAVDLAPGSNSLTLSAIPSGGDTTRLCVSYDASADGIGLPGTKAVRLVWLSTSDGDCSFEVPPPPHPGCDVPHTASDGAARLLTAGRLMQAATAEMMHHQGLGRRTFRLVEDVTHHRLPHLTTAAACRMDGQQLWSHVCEAASGCARRDDLIDVAVMSFSCWDRTAREVRGHTALGGGRLGLFGGSSVWSWPANTAGIADAFTDCRKVDGKVCLDDGGRGRVWALAATTVGAALHELGHCLSLPHPCLTVAADRGGGIMARGFDHLNRLVAVTEAGRPLTGVRPFWDRGCAARLRWHPWISAVGRVPPPGGAATSDGSRDEAKAGGDGLLERALRAQQRLYDATPAVPMPKHKSMAAATPAPAPTTLDDLARKFHGLLHRPAQDDGGGTSSGVAAVSTEDKLCVLSGATLAPGRNPSFAPTTDGRLTVRVGRDMGAGGGLGHLGYYVNGDNAGHEEWVADAVGHDGGPPAAVVLPTPAALRARLGAKATDKLVVSAIDTAGNMKSVDYSKCNTA